MGDQVQQIFSYLRSHHFHFPERWVIEGIEYYRSADPNISFQKLRDEVYNQWLLANLRDMNVPSLPPNLSRHDKITLPGKYAVQVEMMLDASQSCYNQYQQLKKVSLENIEATETPGQWNNKSNRCLTFTLCDGVQEIRAMEYFPINKIRTNDPELLPGFKMLIIGPVDCRKGMILLKEENVKILGGEVDVLCEINNLKSLLCRKLNLEESDDENKENSTDHIDNAVENRLNENEEQNAYEMDTDEDISNLLSQNDELFQSLSFEADFAQADVPNNVEMRDEVVIVPNEVEKNKPSTSKKPVQTTISSFLTQSAKKDNVQVKKNKFPLTINHKPFVYLKLILNSQVNKPAIFTVKAVIMTINKKMGIKDNDFAMTAIISDGSDSVEVSFSSEVLEEIMGYSPDEIIQMHRDKAKNSAIADRLKKINKDAQLRLISLCCLMDIKFSNDDCLPCVLSIEDVKIEHLNALKARQIS